MRSLVSLPDELIVYIAARLTGPQDLLSLFLSAKRFRPLSRTQKMRIEWSLMRRWRTRLLRAAYSFDDEKVSYLLSKELPELDLNIKDDAGKSLLHLLCAEKSPQIDLSRLQVILGLPSSSLKKIEVDAQDACGDTALHVSCRSNARLSVMTLLEMGADATVLNSSGYTPLMVSIEHGHLDAFFQITRYCNQDIALPGYDLYKVLNARGRRGRTALHACVSEHVRYTVDLRDITEMVRILLAAGARCTEVDDDGITPFELAVTNSYHDDVVLLLAQAITNGRQRRLFFRSRVEAMWNDLKPAIKKFFLT